MKIKSFASKRLLIVIPVLAFLIVLSAAVYFYLQYQKTQQLLKNPTAATQLETTEILSKIEKFIELPIGETPTIATILDSQKLKNQPFYARSQNGDKIILYTNAKIAILYRPSENKIIDVSHLTLDTQSSTTKEQTKTNPITIALYNGTETSGVTKVLEKSLTTKYKDITIVAKDNAAKQDYDKTLLIDLHGAKTTEAKALAKELNFEIVTLPEGESAPASADLLIIIGKDYATQTSTNTP